MSLQVGKAIYNLLSNDANVTGRVQNKIYPLIADTGTTFPFIVYRRTGKCINSTTFPVRF